jgi:hypothetical protein
MPVVLNNDEIVLLSLSDALAVQEENKFKPKKQKTSQQRQNQQRKNQEKYRHNQQLSQLPKFTTKRPYETIFINYMTPSFALIRLIELARQTPVFAMDTENDAGSTQPALIQMQLIPFEHDDHDDGSLDKHTKTTVIIFEMCHLPSTTSPIYIFIERLFKTIFQCDKIIFSWSDGSEELSKFTIYSIFQSIPYRNPRHVNVQAIFKMWYNDTHPHVSDCIMSSYPNLIDDPQCSCAHRPYKNAGNKWSLQLAISKIFGQFLDKSMTVNNWGIGLDRRLYENWQLNALNYNITSCLTDEEEQRRQQFVQYVVDDCLALTKLAIQIGYEYLVSIILSILLYLIVFFSNLVTGSEQQQLARMIIETIKKDCIFVHFPFLLFYLSSSTN